MRRLSLAACIALAYTGFMPDSLLAATTHVVTTCADAMQPPGCTGGDDGTVRKALQCAQTGDTIDLTQLQCSRISLVAPLVAGMITVTLNGPGQDRLAIDAGHGSRVLIHNGPEYNLISINGLTIANGYFENTKSYGGGGGCIFSAGSVALTKSLVTSCYTKAHLTAAKGGAIFAQNSAFLTNTSIVGNTAVSAEKSSLGGGVYANTVVLRFSTVSGNRALVGAGGGVGEGGGISGTKVDAYYSTVDSNQASTAGGGISSGLSVVLSDSTVSGNYTSTQGKIGGIYSAGSASISNSTIVGNLGGPNSAAGVYVRGLSATKFFFISSTIIAGNMSDGAPLDVGVHNDVAVSGGKNFIGIVQSGTTFPADTRFGDPGLGPLANNGGPTLTHVPSPGSPVIDAGSSDPQLHTDQRGFPRVQGRATDIGAVEYDLIFGDGFDP